LPKLTLVHNTFAGLITSELPVRPCFLAIDSRGRVRGRYRFARLAILEASEKGWQLEMEGCE
jgi:hypothetical protein